jgi:predicted metal-dependent hydrolase
MNNQVIYGDQTIDFRVRYLQGINAKVAIHVQPDQQIIIDAPPGTTMKAIKQSLLRRARWVSRQQHKLALLHRHALPRQYVSGETHWYMGKRYLLKVKISKTREPGTKLQRGMLLVSTHEQDPALIKALLHNWYLKRAETVFSQRLTAIYPELGWVKQKPPWQLRTMKKQWGSCSPKGKLSLNPLLVKAPRVCIDYVIVHELCHLKHHNHSDGFYKLLKRQLPDWEAVKGRLDNLSEQILM